MAKRALCIGINDYPGTQSDLYGCVNDARDWAALLTQRDFTVQTLFDKKATAQQLRTSIAALALKAKKGDRIVIQYSGHGSFVPDQDGDEADGNDECLCPYDIGTSGPITDDELHEIFSQAQKGVRILMISDSCHSGTITRFAPITTPPTTKQKHAPQRTVRFLPPATYLSRTEVSHLKPCPTLTRTRPRKTPAALLLSGCQDHEYSYDAYFLGRPNGAFTYVALRTLSQLPPEATYADWYKEIRKALPSRQYPQTPNLHGSTAMKRWKVLG